MLLTEREKNIINCLRNSDICIKEIFRKNEITTNEILSLYEKMDTYIEEEGKVRNSLGSYDENFIIDLLDIKKQLKEEYEKNMKSKENENEEEVMKYFLQRYEKCDIRLVHTPKFKSKKEVDRWFEKIYPILVDGFKEYF